MYIEHRIRRRRSLRSRCMQILLRWRDNITVASAEIEISCRATNALSRSLALRRARFDIIIIYRYYRLSCVVSQCYTHGERYIIRRNISQKEKKKRYLYRGNNKIDQSLLFLDPFLLLLFLVFFFFILFCSSCLTSAIPHRYNILFFSRTDFRTII